MLFILFFYSNLATWQLKTKPKQTLKQKVNGLKCSKSKIKNKNKERETSSLLLSLSYQAAMAEPLETERESTGRDWDLDRRPRSATQIVGAEHGERRGFLISVLYMITSLSISLIWWWLTQVVKWDRIISKLLTQVGPARRTQKEWRKSAEDAVKPVICQDWKQ